jgi:hypothetical protein
MERRIGILASVWAAPALASAQALPPPPGPAPEKPRIVIEAPTNIPASAPRTTTPNSAIFLIASSAAAGLSGLRSVSFREEATSPDYVQTYGGASVSGAADVDCHAGTYRLQSFALHKNNNLGGETVTEFGARTKWQQPNRDTLLNRVIELACRLSPSKPRSVATAAPAPSKPAPAQPAAPKTDLSRNTPAPPPVATPPAPAPAASAGRAGYWVQIAAAVSDALAKAALDKLIASEGDLLHGATTSVAQQRVKGAIVFRSLIGPLPKDEAVALCRTLSARGHACFVHL